MATTLQIAPDSREVDEERPEGASGDGLNPDTIPATATELSGKGGSMARRRYQKGQVYLCGEMWYGRYREDVVRDGKTVRVRRNVPLGTKKEYPTKRLAERRMEQMLGRINSVD